MIPWLATVYWRISSHQVSQFHTQTVTCSHRMKAEACIALQPKLEIRLQPELSDLVITSEICLLTPLRVVTHRFNLLGRVFALD